MVLIKFRVSAMLLFFGIIGQAQEKLDTIYTINKTIIGKVKEVGDEISYSHPNEDVIYRIKKRQVLRISFSSGRKEIFNTHTAYETVRGAADWQKVNVSFIPEESEGMIKLGLVSTKASGLTTFSSTVNVQNRAFQKLKQSAAMLGGNVVLVNDQAIEGSMAGQRSTRTQIMATVYRSEPLDTAGIYQDLALKKFKLVKKLILGPNDFRPATVSQMFTVLITFDSKSSVVIRNNIPYIKMSINEPVTDFRLISYNKEGLVVGYQLNNKIVEITFQPVVTR